MLNSASRRWGKTALFVFLVTSAMVGACTPATTVRVWEEPSVFRGEWHDYYRRAMWRLQEGEKKVHDDLLEAIAGNPTDSWEARTYGVQFIEYFPNRELGILLYEEGRSDEALAYLEASYNSAPSSRCSFYLNRTRRDRLVSQQADTEKPVLTLSEWRPATRELSFVLSGTATDDHYVSRVTIDGRPVLLDLASPEVPFRERVALQPGENLVQVVVEDLVGNRNELVVPVLVDRQAPLLAVQEMEVLGNRVHLRAVVTDNGELHSATVNHQVLDMAGQQRRALDLTFQNIDIAEGLPFRLTDEAGNYIEGTLDLSRPLRTASRLPPAPLFTRGPARVATDATAPSLGLAGTAPLLAHEGPPHIQLRGMDGNEELEVFMDRAVLEGRIRGAAPIQSLRINGREILDIEGMEIHFGEIVELSSATNAFRIEATDKQGQHSREEVRIRRHEPVAFSIGTRVAVALSPLEFLPGTEDYAPGIGALLHRAFVEGRRFRVLEQEQVEALLLERDISRSALADSHTAARLAREQASDVILTGFVRHRPHENGLEIVGQLVEVATARVLFVHDVYDENLDAAQLERMLVRLYLKFERHFPLLDGDVLSARSRRLTLKTDHSSLLWDGMEFVVYRPGRPIVHPETGRTLGNTTTILGQGRIEGWEEDQARLELEKDSLTGQIQPGDRVLAR